MVAVWAEPGHHYASAELLLQLFLLRLDSRIAVWVRFSYVDSGHDRLSYAIEFCDTIINPYSEEVVRRAGSWKRYHNTVWTPWKIEIIRKAFKGFGYELL